MPTGIEKLRKKTHFLKSLNPQKLKEEIKMGASERGKVKKWMKTWEIGEQ